MATALKHVYSPAYIDSLSAAIAAEHAAFDQGGFAQWLFADNWEALELKDRMRKISSGLHRHLALPYRDALAVLMPVATKFGGGAQGDYVSMFFPDYVERFGLDDYEASIPALAHFTQYSSAEFAVRPFIKQYGQAMMDQMLQWAQHDNYFVRRLASEGCRPRLPWAMALPQFKQNPAPIMPILECLKADESLFVRRSVANNLNDIAKDNPAITVAAAKRWLGHSADTDWLVKHGCRTLLKQGHAELMPLFGFAPPTAITLLHFDCSPSVSIGGTLSFSFELHSKQPLGQLRLEYGIDFLRNNGKLGRKIFQIGESETSANTKTVVKNHNFKVISTRRYYTGVHGLHIIVNGQPMAEAHFVLQAAS